MAHSDAVMARFYEPAYLHIDDSSDARVGRAGARVAGAQIEIYLRPQGDKTQARFKAYGCPATIASADWLAQAVSESAADAKLPDKHAIIAALQLPPARQHAAALAVEALQQALDAPAR